MVRARRIAEAERDWETFEVTKNHVVVPAGLSWSDPWTAYPGSELQQSNQVRLDGAPGEYWAADFANRVLTNVELLRLEDAKCYDAIAGPPPPPDVARIYQMALSFAQDVEQGCHLSSSTCRSTCGVPLLSVVRYHTHHSRQVKQCQQQQQE